MGDPYPFQVSIAIHPQFDLIQGSATGHEGTAESWMELLPPGVRDRIALHVTRGVWNADAQRLTVVSPRWCRSVWYALLDQVYLELPFLVLQEGKQCNARRAQIEAERNKMVESCDGRPDYYEFHCWREVRRCSWHKVSEGEESEVYKHFRIADILNALVLLSDEKTLHLEFDGTYLSKLAIKFRRLSVDFTDVETIRTAGALKTVRKIFGTLRFNTLSVGGRIAVPRLMNEVVKLCAKYVRGAAPLGSSVKWTAIPIRTEREFYDFMAHYEEALLKLPDYSFVEVHFSLPPEQVHQKFRSFCTLSLSSHPTPPDIASDIGEPLVKVDVHFFDCNYHSLSTPNFLDLHKLGNCSRLKELRVTACSHVLPTLAAVLKRLPLLRKLWICVMESPCYGSLSSWSNVINSTHHSLKLGVHISFRSLTECRELFKCFGHRLNWATVGKVGQGGWNASSMESVDYLEMCLSSIALYNPNILRFLGDFVRYETPLEEHPQRARRLELLAKKLVMLRPNLNCARIQLWMDLKLELVAEHATNKRAGESESEDRRKRLRRTACRFLLESVTFAS